METEENIVSSGNFGGGEELVAASLKPQYLDEIVLGTEYEILPDTKIGVAYFRRDLGRVIEDVSTDGANTYIIANPGEVDEAAVADLRRQAAAAANSGDKAREDYLNYQADTFEGVGLYDKPKRIYNALQLTVNRRFTRNFFLAGSYTYSQTKGNYPGLFSQETNQLDPNITSLFDLPELLANRYGPLGNDRPHLFKVDGFYILPVRDVGLFTFGASARAQSGVPMNTLGRHELYGADESYILERGSAGRIGMSTRFDTHLAYALPLSRGMKLEAFIRIFNIFNQQPAIEVDERYTNEPVNPIVGGDQEDLAHLKVLGTGRTPQLWGNYKNASRRQDPLSAQFGLRFVF